MLTQLPIEEYEPCKLLLLRKNEHEHPSHYHDTHDIWQPLGLPISGAYDNYGCLIPESIKHNFSFRFMQAQILALHEIDISHLNTERDSRRYGDVFAWGYSKTLKATRLRQETDYGIAFISGAVYDAGVRYIRQMPVGSWLHIDKPTTEGYLRESYARVLPDLKLWAHYWSYMPGLKNSDTDELLLNAPLPPIAQKRAHEDATASRDFYFEADEREGMMREALRYSRDNLGWSRRLMKALAQDETTEGLEAYIDTFCLNQFMQMTRQMYMPQGSMGNPAWCSQAQSLLINLMQAKLNDRLAYERRRQEDLGESDN